jgi:hypothetical protein
VIVLFGRAATEGKAVDDIDRPHELRLVVVYVDDDLTELEATVGAGYWSGRARAYTVPQDIATFASALQQFGSGASAGAEFVAGADTGIGLIALRFYRVDRSGHIACHVRLVTGRLPGDHRPEEVSRLSVEVRAEGAAVDRFARQLSELARTQAGQAVLSLEVAAD